MEISNNLMKSMGWQQALIRVAFFIGLGFVAQRLLATNYDVDPMIWGVTAFISASVTLLLLAQPGDLSLSVLKRKETWIYGLLLISVAMCNTFMFQHISTTEGSLLHRLSLVMGMCISWFWYKRRNEMTWDRKIGTITILSGAAIILFTLREGAAAPVLSVILLICMMEAIRIFTAENHPDNESKHDFKTRCRVAGVTVLASSLLYLAFILIICAIQYKANTDIKFLPQFNEFTAPQNIYGGMILGILFVAPIRYLEFSSVRLIRAENSLAMASFVPLATLGWELVFSRLLPVSSLDVYSISALIIITIGAIIMIAKRISKECADMGIPVYSYFEEVEKRQKKEEEEYLKWREQTLEQEQKAYEEIEETRKQRYKKEKEDREKQMDELSLRRLKAMEEDT